MPTWAFKASFAAAAVESGAGVIAQVSTSPPPSGRRPTPTDERKRIVPIARVPAARLPS